MSNVQYIVFKSVYFIVLLNESIAFIISDFNFNKKYIIMLKQTNKLDEFFFCVPLTLISIYLIKYADFVPGWLVIYLYGVWYKKLNIFIWLTIIMVFFIFILSWFFIKWKWYVLWFLESPKFGTPPPSR